MTSTRSKRSVLGLALATAASALVLAGPASPASAYTPAPRNGTCDRGEVCFYYYTYLSGSVSDFASGSSISNYGSTQPTCYEFRGVGAGRYTCIKNNVESVFNRSGRSVTVFYNSGYTGASQTIGAGQSANLSARLINNNASHRSN